MLLATIGDPVAQLQTPSRMPQLLAERGINATWLPLHVTPRNLPVATAMVREIENFLGFSVTVPHKTAMMALVDKLTPRALLSGSLNLVRREPDGTLLGDMVDGLGFVRGLTEAGHRVQDSDVWLVGTGGAGSAIAAALCEAGVRSLCLTDIAAERAGSVVERLRNHFPSIEVTATSRRPEAPDFAINATALGLRPNDPLPFQVEGLPLATVVCDIIMKPANTKLQAAAAALGMRTHPGAPMLSAQMPLYLEFFGF